MPRRRIAPQADDRRPPLARLESFVAEPAIGRSQRILMRIRNELDASLEPGAWISAARSLEARGLISADTAIYFTTIFLECITFHALESDTELLRLTSEMKLFERAQGLQEDETWLISEAPAEWLAMNDAWERRNKAILVATLRELGQADLADLLERNPVGFEDRGTAGYRDLWGSIDNSAN